MNLRTAFSTLGASGIGDPASLQGAVSELSQFTVFALSLSLVGMAVFVYSLVRLRRLPRSFPPPLPSFTV